MAETEEDCSPKLVQEAEGWGERLSELEEEMKMCESSHKDMVEQCTSKDQCIQVFTCTMSEIALGLDDIAGYFFTIFFRTINIDNHHYTGCP